MDLPDNSNPAGQSGTDRRRQIQRLTNAFFLQSLDALLGATRRDMVSAILIMAIIDANTRELDLEDPATAPYRDMASPVPDGLRRPVSAYAIAKRLGMAYETVRRHVLKLLAEGVCVRVGDEGVIVPAAYLAAPAVTQGVHANNRNVAAYVTALDRAGAIEGLLRQGRPPG